MTDEVLIIDGTALLFRSFFGGVSVIAPDGIEVGAVMLSCSKLGQLVAQFSPKHIAVVFDAGQRTFRNDIEPSYKANRGAPPPSLIPQFDLLREASKALGFATFSRVGYEADDLMATLARLCHEAELNCRLVSIDKDIAQVVRDGPPHAIQQDPYSDRAWDAAGVGIRMGVPPNQVCSYMALVGDSTDNIPGVRGVGPKTAAAAVRHFGSLDQIFSNIERVSDLPIRGAKTLGAKLAKAEADARLALSLVTLDDAVPLNLKASDLQSTLRWTGPEQHQANALFDRMGFHRPLNHLRVLAQQQY